ncbi:MAG TPA: S41 family peptidase, partial [Gemmatimonadales bacterium]|nr:S41 family peptidase [Gemmatimonadales bacterium]
GGIGARLGVRRDTTLIVSVLPASPAARARLKPFDRIVTVAGHAVVGLPTDSIVSLIRGPVGTPITLGLRRGLDDSAVEASPVRAEVQIPSVPAGALLPDGVGVVRLAQFGPATAQETVEAMDWMVSGHAKAVILDLRDNPGGILEQALETAQLFLPLNSVLVQVRGRPGAGSESPRTSVAPRYPAIPLAVLINEGSASAAEVLAAALQEYHRAVVAGRQSYGKGSVQHIANLPDGWAVKLTIARWYTPHGVGLDRGPQPEGQVIDPTEPHAGGVHPDILLPRDTVPELVTRAALAAGPRWDSLNLAILDWIQAAADTMSGLQPDFEADSGAALALITRVGMDQSPPGTAPVLTEWVRRALSRGVVGARFGEMEDGAWGLMHDAEVAQVADSLLARR